jgi:hypothetical protein
VVGERLLTERFEDIRSERDTPRISVTRIQINRNAHICAPCLRRQGLLNAAAQKVAAGLDCGSATRNSGNRVTALRARPEGWFFHHHLHRPNIVVRIDNDRYVGEVRVALWPDFRGSLMRMLSSP